MASSKEMIDEFGRKLNKFTKPIILQTSDILFWINEAQLQFVIDRFNGMNSKRRSFEQSQELIDDLKSLVRNNSAIETYRALTSDASGSIGIDGFYGDSATLPNEHLYTISVRANTRHKNGKDITPYITYTGSPQKRELNISNVSLSIVVCKNSQHDDIYRLLLDPFNKASISNPLYVTSENKITVFTDKTFIVTKINLDYIKKPRNVVYSLTEEENVNSELPIHTHDDVVDLAVKLFRQSLPAQSE